MKGNKIKDMVRSILPSKSRRTARELKAISSRRVRRAVRGELHVEDPETTKADWTRAADQSAIVWQRRGADKLNHFMRWGDALTNGMATDDALSFVRGLLPKNLIGQHAYGHWQAHKARKRYHYTPYERRLQSWIDSTRFHLKRALAEDPALHGRLNAEIKSRRMFDEERRLLAGIHDADEFVRDIAKEPYAAERAATKKLIEEHEKGGRKAALRILGWRYAGRDERRVRYRTCIREDAERHGGRRTLLGSEWRRPAHLAAPDER